MVQDVEVLRRVGNERSIVVGFRWRSAIVLIKDNLIAFIHYYEKQLFFLLRFDLNLCF